MISCSICPAFALDTLKACDANTLPHYGPHNPSHIYIKDENGNMPFFPLVYHTAILHDDDVWNTSTQPKIVQVTLIIQNQDAGQQVFNQTQSLQMKACSGPESVKWRFVPIQIANYIANVADDRGTVGMIFGSMLDATKSQTVASPLEQLRFGIDSHGVVCKQDLQLVIRSEDDSPACVKPENISILVKRGWAKQEFYHIIHALPKMTLNDYSYNGVDKENNMTVSINSQTYYQTTLDYSAYNLPKSTPIQFHNVIFTFPAGTMTTPGGAFVMLDMKFQDGFEEIYGTNTGNEFGGISIPTLYGPHMAENSTTILSNHMTPQAGMTIFYDKIRLLVSK